jgi:hypothetical protein
VGMDTDSLLDLYSTSINSTDDTGTAYDATNGNAINSVSVGKGFGTGSIVLLGYNNAGAGGVWSEISSTGLVDFLGNSYDPFGTNLTQTNLSVDRVFRVTNQLSTRMDNFSLASTNMPQIYDLLRVDSNGLTLAPGSSLAGTTIMKTTDISGNTNFSIRSMATNFGSLVSGGAFEGKDSYFGEEFNTVQQTNTNMTGGTANTSVTCAWARGDYGGKGSGTNAACSATANSTNIPGTGELSLGYNNGATGDQCTPSQPAGVNGVERLLLAATTTAHSAHCALFLTGGAAGVHGDNYQAANLPVMSMKIKASTLPSSNNNRIYLGLFGSNAVAGLPANTVIPGTAGGTGGVFFTNCTATTPTCVNTGWNAWVVNGSTTLSYNAACTGTLSTTQFAYFRIEFRSSSEVHFYADADTSNGIQETECGTGATTGVFSGVMTPWFEVSTGAASINTGIDIDYFRLWQDDNIPTPAAQANQTTTLPDGQSIAQTPPLTTDNSVASGPPEDSNSLFSFNAATSDDSVFNKDVYLHGTLFADKIQANQIEGLQVFTDKISSLQQKLTAALDPHASAQTTGAAGSVLPTTNPELNLNIPGSLSINGPAEFHGNVFFYKLVTFTEKTLFNKDRKSAAHLTTAGDTPAIKLEVAAGVSQAPADNPSAVLAKVSISGNDNSGTLNINIGDNSTAGNLLTLNFAKPYDHAPQIFLTPANKDAAQFKYYVTSATDGFKIVATDPLPASANPQFYYWVVQ